MFATACCGEKKKLLLVGALYRFVRQMYDCSIAFLIV